MSSSESSELAQSAIGAVQPPRRRKTTSNEDRERVVTAYENGATHAAISEMLNIKLATVYGIVKRYQTAFQVEAKKRGGNRQKVLSQQAISDIQCWINDDCTVTLKSLAQKLLQEHGVRVSTTTIAREIKGFNDPLKMVKVIPERRNTPTTIETSTRPPTPPDHSYCPSPRPSSVLVEENLPSSEMTNVSETEGCQSSFLSSASTGGTATTLNDVEGNLYALTKLVTNVAAEVRLIFNVVCGGSDTMQRSLKFPRIATLKSLKDLNEKLGSNSIYMAEMVSYFLHLLKLENDIDRRLTIMLDLMFDREFFSKCSWTGLEFPEPKIRLCEFVFVICLFKTAGSNNFIQLTDEFVKEFFSKKLHHGKSRCFTKSQRLFESRKRRKSE
uniref:DUF4806 domain-containing protein n=1 Tax=Anopheles funestus TaxID=62324 RepID=A0A4Y0BHG9_ANOFN